MEAVSTIIANKTEFLKFLKAKFTMIHRSNVFHRDLHYGIMEYLGRLGMKAKYAEAELITRRVESELERQNILKRIDEQSWLLNYPDFALPRIEKKAP